MIIPLYRGMGSAPPGTDADFVSAFERYEQLQAAAASGIHSSGSLLVNSAAGTSKGFADGLSAWLNPQLAIQDISAAVRNLEGTNVSYFAGLISVPLGLVFLIRRRR